MIQDSQSVQAKARIMSKALTVQQFNIEYSPPLQSDIDAKPMQFFILKIMVAVNLILYSYKYIYTG